jgi:hypothetical protein
LHGGLLGGFLCGGTVGTLNITCSDERPKHQISN